MHLYCHDNNDNDIIILLHTSILLQFGCCSNAFLNIGTLCGATSEECELNELERLLNGGASTVLYSTVGIFISLIFTGLALVF